MSQFSITFVRLNADGSRFLDAKGQPAYEARTASVLASTNALAELRGKGFQPTSAFASVDHDAQDIPLVSPELLVAEMRLFAQNSGLHIGLPTVKSATAEKGANIGKRFSTVRATLTADTSALGAMLFPQPAK